MSAELQSRAVSEDSDWALVAAAKHGEDGAFEMLVRRYKARILSLALRITRNREDAQDVTQQSFQNAFVHLQKFQGKSSFSTWLTRIAINEALMCLRKNRVLQVVSLEEVGCEHGSILSMDVSNTCANPEETYIRREKELILSSVIDKLPPILQTAVCLHLGPDFSVCQQFVTLTTPVHPTTCSRVQQFSLWHQVAISQALPNVCGLAARVLFIKRCDANG